MSKKSGETIETAGRRLLIHEALDLGAAKAKLATRIERRAYNRFKLGNEKEVQVVLFSQKVRAFEEELSTLLTNSGCRKQAGSLTNDVIRARLLSESNSSAASILNTYNVHLVGAILSVTKAEKSPTWLNYLLGLAEWKRRRDKFKVQQVSEWSVNRVRNEAAREFYIRNKVFLSEGTGGAILRGPRPAKESICQGWINRGIVPLREALAITWPPHLGCPHFWDYINPPRVGFLRRRGICPQLWAGE